MADDYEGPVRLQRKIPWGKRDRATGFAVLSHMVDANPPTVIPWSIHTKKLKRALRHDDVFDIGAEELQDLVTRRSGWFAGVLPRPISDSERLARNIAHEHLRAAIENPRVVIVEKVPRAASGT